MDSKESIFDWGRENVAFCLAAGDNRALLSLPQSPAATAPSSEGAFGRCRASNTQNRPMCYATGGFVVSANA